MVRMHNVQRCKSFVLFGRRARQSCGHEASVEHMAAMIPKMRMAATILFRQSMIIIYVLLIFQSLYWCIRASRCVFRVS